jgi:hypothetical protein
VNQPSIAIAMAKSNGSHLPSLLPITAFSLGSMNLGRVHQTKDATVKRLHDGMDDAFVSSFAGGLISPPDLASRQTCRGARMFLGRLLHREQI